MVLSRRAVSVSSGATEHHGGGHAWHRRPGPRGAHARGHPPERCREEGLGPRPARPPRSGRPYGPDGDPLTGAQVAAAARRLHAAGADDETLASTVQALVAGDVHRAGQTYRLTDMSDAHGAAQDALLAVVRDPDRDAYGTAAQHRTRRRARSPRRRGSPGPRRARPESRRARAVPTPARSPPSPGTRSRWQPPSPPAPRTCSSPKPSSRCS